MAENESESTVSNLDAILRTNCIPNDVQQHQIRGICSTFQEEIDVLDTRMCEVQTEMDTLAGKRHIAQEKLNMHKALVSPMRRMPLDLLREASAISQLSCCHISHD